MADVARSQEISGLRIAAVSCGDLTGRIANMGLTFQEDGEKVSAYRDRTVSVEPYLGAEGIVEALDGGAEVVVTTRVADACLYLGPLAHEFGWDFDDYDSMARGMILGHLLIYAEVSKRQW